MGLRINHNIAALNAWRQLNATDRALAKSLEKLSSGYRINRAGDDPAGLVISEKLRAQITGLNTAMRNTQDAISMIQTAEGALSEMHSLLNSMRALALHATNTGANDSDSIAADQAQIDSAVDALERIADTTKYGDKYLLNGSAATVTRTILDTTNIDTVVLGTNANGATTIPSATISAGYLAYRITQSATVAKVEGDVVWAASSKAIESAKTGEVFSGEIDSGALIVNGVTIFSANAGKVFGTSGNLALSGGVTIASAISAMNTLFDNDSRTAYLTAYLELEGGGTSAHLVIAETRLGSKYVVTVHDSVNGAGTVTGVMFSAGAAYEAGAGTDVSGWIGTSTTLSYAHGDGLTLWLSGSNTSADDYYGTSITFTSAGNVATSAQTNDISIAGGSLVFQLGAFATTSEQATQSISDMQTAALGTNATKCVANLVTGKAYALATDASTAVTIIDDAIDDVSLQRSRLGAFQANTLESTLNTLSVAKENLVDSESRIRDVDMAAEMMEFTRNQIMVQAGTAMLAQANTSPQAVLQLLR